MLTLIPLAAGLAIGLADPQVIEPRCTTFFGLPCHEPGRPTTMDGPTQPVVIRERFEDFDDWFDGPEQPEPEACE